MARSDHAVWFVNAEDGNRVGAGEATHCLLHGLEQVAVVHVVDQVGDHFGVGLAFKDVTGDLQIAAQLFKVFDDAVVDQGDALTREVRVGVVGGWCAVGCPARVGNAGEASQVAFGHLLL